MFDTDDDDEQQSKNHRLDSSPLEFVSD